MYKEKDAKGKGCERERMHEEKDARREERDVRRKRCMNKRMQEGKEMIHAEKVHSGKDVWWEWERQCHKKT